MDKKKRQYTQEDFALILVEDRGYRIQKNGQKARQALFECTECGNQKLRTYAGALNNNSGLCNFCSTNKRNKKRAYSNKPVTALLNELLYLDEATDIFYWKKNGKKAGTDIHGYIDISLGKKRYKAHRLVWLYYHNTFPKGVIDHINHDTKDNRIENLRDVTMLDNMKNMRLYRKNKTGAHNVSWNPISSNWRVRIGVNGKAIEVGSFKNKEDAIAARKAAEVKYNFHELHGLKQ